MAGGRVKAIFSPKGRKVGEGDTLAAVESSPLIQTWVKTGLALIEARQGMIMLERWYREGRVSRGEYEEADRRLASLRKAYFAAKEDLARAYLIAPVGGRVIDWFVSVGDTVEVGQPVVLLANIDPQAIARVGLAERDYYFIEEGDSAIVTTLEEVGLPLDGVVQSKGMSESVTGLPFSADILFENPGGAITIGERISATITGKRTMKAVLIPKDALVDRQGGEASVFLTDSKAEFAVRRHVVLGPEVGHNIIIDKGLRKGDRLIIHGQDRLKNGRRIMIIQANP